MITARFVAYKLLGLKKYLRLVSKVYIKQIEKGRMKEQYPEIHFLKTIINQGATCIDIGANLGYYSYFLSKYVGKAGKVYAVEPISL
ncbi:MAG: FkbM family methyltransferase, partial [Bacteroidales bacterium]|nr:FkbM family methyltransferase [Bacteroidales bacterium]